MSVSKIVSFGSGQTHKHTTECSSWSTKVFDKAVIDHSRLRLSPELQPATVIIVQKNLVEIGCSWYDGGRTNAVVISVKLYF